MGTCSQSAGTLPRRCDVCGALICLCLCALFRHLSLSVFARSTNAPDESLEEQRGVADDPRGAGLLVLAALQGQTVVHVTFGVQARLERAETKARETPSMRGDAGTGAGRDVEAGEAAI